MRHKDTIFYRGKTEISVDFSAEQISSDGALVLLEKIEREHKLLHYFSNFIPDSRHPFFITHSIKKLLKQRVYMMMQGYQDANDVFHLQHDPLYKDILQGDLASQPTISRFENSLNKKSIFELCYAWIDRYVYSLKGRESITIDIDATDDATYGKQQLSLFNGYYGKFMYNELFFHDGDTGQIIVPVLRPGNSHSNKWYIAILKRVLIKIRKTYPQMAITIRADSGFSCSDFYVLADDYNLKYAIGLASNAVLKAKTVRVEKAIKHLYLSKRQKNQHFISFTYGANSWHKAQQCYSKIESTGLGLNIRHFVSNIEAKDAREIYFDFYVKRGDSSENRIKEVKNMCFSD